MVAGPAKISQLSNLIKIGVNNGPIADLFSTQIWQTSKITQLKGHSIISKWESCSIKKDGMQTFVTPCTEDEALNKL